MEDAEQFPSTEVDIPRRRCWHDSSHTDVEKMVTYRGDSSKNEAAVAAH